MIQYYFEEDDHVDVPVAVVETKEGAEVATDI